MRAFLLAGLAVATLSGCSGRAAEPIRDFGSASISTYEAQVVIQKELTLPPNFNTLPQPIPGGPNRADP